MKILVAGADGQLARSLVAAAADGSQWQLVALGRPTLDLLRRDSLVRAMDAVAPALVVNAAAYTAVDRAESEEELATAINSEGAGALAEIAAQRDIPIIHVSTDYVFDGRKQEPYRETDQPNPETAYGRSKLAGEIGVAAANKQHIILRTSWVHSAYGHNFVKTILRLASERPELRVVADQHGSPTYAADLASAILTIARHIERTGGAPDLWGLYHVAGAGFTTWHGLAQAVVTAAARYGRSAVTVHPIATSDYPTPARRPANSRLDCGKVATAFGVHLAPWLDGVERCVALLCSQIDLHT